MRVQKSAMRKTSFLHTVLCAALFAVLLTGCDLTKNQLKIDREGDKQVQDYRDSLAPRLPEPDAEATESKVPELQPYVADVSENLKPMPLVSISVNQTVPVRDVLFELAQQADYDIELDPRIKGSIIFTARERPFDLVVQRIAEIAGLRYKFEDDILRVELDSPYQKNYKVDYLSFIRKNKGSIRNDVSVVSGEGTDTGSNFEAASESEADFWGELEVNLAQILGASTELSSLKTKKDPRITATTDNPAPIAPTTPAGVDGAAVPPPVDGQVAPTTAPPAPGQAPQAVLRVDSLPTDEDEDPNAQQAGADKGNGVTFAINKQAGIISVIATEKLHKEIERYLTELKRSVTSQVLIEAKVLEVSLTDEFATGIDWFLVDGLLSGELNVGVDTVGDTLAPVFEPISDPNISLDLAYVGNDIQAVIQAVSRFGTVKALASPRLTVLNNQSAVLNVANNQVYFEIDIDVTTEEGVTQTDIDSDIKNVPEGVLINVQPSINLDDKTISLAVRPTITRIVEFVNDPAVSFVVASADLDSEITSPVPVVNIQEMDSVVRMKSGQAILMGGLMQDRATSQQTGAPVLSEIPVMGALFRNQGDKIQKTELVVFIKATIVEGDESIHDTDRDLYRTFSGDRRPLKL